MDNSIHTTIASYAKEELNVTNRIYVPWVNTWVLVSLLIFLAYLHTGNAQFLPWGAVCLAFPMTSNATRIAVLVRRQWGLHKHQLHLAAGQHKLEMTPDARSRRALAITNVQGLLMTALLLAAINFHFFLGGATHAPFDRFVMGFSDAWFVGGIVLHILAESHEPTFT